MKETPQVIIFPRGQLEPRDKERLTKAGIVAVEADDPSKVVAVAPSASVIRADDLLVAALHGLAERSYGDSAATFVSYLRKFAVARHDLVIPPPNTPK